MRRAFLITAFIIAVASSALSQTIAITNGKIYPVSGPPIPNGTVLIRDGVITAVGSNLNIPSA